jgi:hypothetical protein
MSGSFDNLPRLQSLDEGEYGKISAGLRPPHSIFTEADSSIDWAAGIEEIRQSPDRQHIDGGHTIALKAEGSGAGS